MHLIESLLTRPMALLMDKIILTRVFWLAGVPSLFNFKVIVQEMIDANLPSPKRDLICSLIKLRTLEIL